MSRQDFYSSSHAVVTLRLPIVFVTKYRRKAITPAEIEVDSKRWAT